MDSIMRSCQFGAPSLFGAKSTLLNRFAKSLAWINISDILAEQR